MQVATEAVVLHAFDYMESSRIVRLATRDMGLVSAIARGVRRPRSRLGGVGALDLYTGGSAQLAVRPGRDLQTLTGFDATRSRQGLAASLEHFTAAAAFSELALRFLGDQPDPAAYDTLVGALDALTDAAPDEVGGVVLQGAWMLIAELGFAPAVAECAQCDTPIPPEAAAPFSHTAGGLLCASCASMSPAGRPLPPSARDALSGWLVGLPHPVASAAELAAHQRLLRLFIQAHLGDGRPLPAYEVWELRRWG